MISKEFIKIYVTHSGLNNLQDSQLGTLGNLLQDQLIAHQELQSLDLVVVGELPHNGQTLP